MAYRCSNCREMGHTTRVCQRDAWEAEEMRISYARAAKSATQANKQRLLAVTRGDLSGRSVNSVVIDSRDHAGNVVFMVHEVAAPPFRLVSRGVNGVVSATTKQVPKSLVKIQEILFDNSQDLPDGLYKQLMDALVIKG
jgi:hypothetical protein